MTPDEVGIEFTKSMQRVSKAIGDGIKAALKDVADVAKDEHAATAPLVPGADRKFSNWPQAPLSISTKIDAGQELRISPRGAWGLAEGGRKPGAMKAWGHPAKHPGTAGSQGKKAWSRARVRVESRSDEVVVEAVDELVQKAV